VIRFQFVRRYFLALCTAVCLIELGLALKEYFINYSGAGQTLLSNGTNIGGDFPIFYSIGKLFRTNPSELYNFSLQLQTLRSLFVGTVFSDLWLVFVYPPPVAAMFSLFSELSLLHAYFFWLTISLLLFLTGSYLVISKLHLPNIEKLFVFLVGLSFLPFNFNCLGAGQLSVIGLLIFSLVYLCRTQGKEFLEGVVLGFGFYKPPLFVFVGLLAIVEKRWRTVLGAVLTASLLTAWSLYLVGPSVLLDYLTVASNYRYGTDQTSGVSLPPFRGVGLYAFLTQHLGSGKLTITIFALAILFTLTLLKSVKKLSNSNQDTNSLLFAAEISLSVLFSIQCINYDLTLLIPAFYVALSFILKNRLTAVNFSLIACLIVFHLEWLFRIYPTGMEYSPMLPPLIALWSMALVAAAIRSRLR
jgi:hypothetical protein